LLLRAHEAILGHDRGDGRFEPIKRLTRDDAGRRGAVRAQEPAVRLRLGSDMALRVAIPLPVAALENLPQAVSFQLDRYTPFMPDQVYFACKPGEREGNIISVAATIVERTSVAEAIAAAKRLGFSVNAIEIEDGSGRDAVPDLLSVPEIGRASRRQIALTAASVVLLAALGAAAVLLPMHRQEDRIAALDQRIAAARIDAEASLRIAKAIEADRRAADFLVDRKRNQPSAIDVLLELTRLAPDDTWIERAEFSNGTVEVSGISPSASGLIARFETSKVLHNAEFRSPVTPDPTTGREHFVISAHVSAGGGP
ncbi:MAG: PilN domain-containing protein, partial [Stellaceae bacterium]